MLPHAIADSRRKSSSMRKLRLPSALSRLTMRIGTKLAIAVGIGVVLVISMIVNQQRADSLVLQQAKLERDEQFVTADLLRASIALQRMQIGTREIRLAISEREADQALAGLRESMMQAVGHLQTALRRCAPAENCERLTKLVTAAQDYAATSAEIVALKKDYAEINKPLEKVNKVGMEIDALVEKAISVAEALASQRMVVATTRMTETAQVGMGFGIFVIFILTGAGIFGVLSIGRPVRHIAGVLLQLANGTREFDIPYTGRGDEVGDAARAARTLRDNLVRLEKGEAEQKQAAALAAAERKEMVRDLADKFEQATGNIVGAVSAAATELESAAGALTMNAEATQKLSAAVAIVSKEASVNVQLVASATDEVGASIGEIGRQARQSTEIAARAVKQAEQTDTRIAELSNSASRIGDVVTVITSIAGQTNLLALNATIEAARAGEAGRGFAVVANEVKLLATQTAKATETIKMQIAEMQDTTNAAVDAIKEISGTIGHISQIAATITAAVNTQSAATQEIAHKVALAAQGAAQVATNITDVNRDADETRTESAKVLQAAQVLSGESRTLELEVRNFIDTVRAA
ncbi:MAG TPA: methyl-accepting chemotaxis protein [Xanthobacteraceae bacterium]